MNDNILASENAKGNMDYNPSLHSKVGKEEQMENPDTAEDGDYRSSFQ